MSDETLVTRKERQLLLGLVEEILDEVIELDEIIELHYGKE